MATLTTSTATRSAFGEVLQNVAQIPVQEPEDAETSGPKQQSACQFHRSY
jgi:hypothetical protein